MSHIRFRSLGSGRVIALLLVVAGLLPPVDAGAGRLPSRADDAAAASRQADLAKVQDLVAQSVVREALAAQGLSPAEAQRRLAQLSAEDLRSLAAQTDQIQAAGRVPQYIWILLAILIAVTILATVL
jgi:uncharacterized protein with beta-barrel porin domain